MTSFGSLIWRCLGGICGLWRYTCFKCKGAGQKQASAALKRIPETGERQIRNNRQIMFLCGRKEINSEKGKQSGAKDWLFFSP